MKLTSKEIISKYNVNYSDLKSLRESNVLSYDKKGNSYVYDINEELAKSFFKTSITTNTSITSTNNEVDYQMGSTELEFPDITLSTFTNRSKEEKKRYGYDLRDYYIKVFRRVSERSKVSSSIDEIVNEITVPFADGTLIKIDYTNGNDIGAVTKKSIEEEWQNITNAMNIDDNFDELVRDWYIDGVLAVECIYNNNNIKDGIIDYLKLNPIGLREVKQNGEKLYTYTNTYYNVDNIQKTDKTVYKEEQIVSIGSGFWDEDKVFETSYLKTALKAINDLSHIENSIIKYRITRASERNIWNVDVGNMPKQKAEQHINTVSNTVKSNLRYNTETGSVNVDVTEGITSDWIFPSRNGKQKTSVESINGNSDFISKLEDLQYFRRELYEALKIPVGRLDGDSSLDYSGQDILREEIKFNKLINKFRRKLSSFFKEILKRQVISTGKVSLQEWEKYSNNIKLKWNVTNPIIENSEIENLKMKLESFADLKESGVIGKYISVEYAVQNILSMTSEEFDEQQEIIKKEKKKYKELYASEDDEDY